MQARWSAAALEFGESSAGCLRRRVRRALRARLARLLPGQEAWSAAAQLTAITLAEWRKTVRSSGASSERQCLGNDRPDAIRGNGMPLQRSEEPINPARPLSLETRSSLD